MNILFTTERGVVRDTYFPAPVIGALEKLGEVTFNEKEAPLTPQELASSIPQMDICLTHWGCPPFSAEVLAQADRLALIVHAAGTVADLVTPAVYERGIKVCSANSIMAQYVAEGVLADILAALRWIPQHDAAMKRKAPWDNRVGESRSLFGARVSLIGLGTIGRFLLDLLRPFGAHVKVFDPYLSPQTLAAYPAAELCPSLAEVLAWGEVVSLHASLTPATRGLLNRENLKWLRPGALLVNTARGAIIDEPALIEALNEHRFRAVLDVYATEPLPRDHPLRELDNVILLPHVAGITAREQMSWAMLDEIERFSKGQPLQHEIAYEKFVLMTREH